MASVVDKPDFPTWATSYEADFAEGTWTFKLCNERYVVSAGPYALVHNDDYDAIMHEISDARATIKAAERLLRRVLEVEYSVGIGGPLHEAIEAFFDPKPLA